MQKPSSFQIYNFHRAIEDNISIYFCCGFDGDIREKYS